MNSNIQAEAEAIHDQFADHLDISVEDVKQRFENLVVEYSLPVDEAARSIKSHYADEAGLSEDELPSGDNEDIGVGNIDTQGQWYDLTATVVDLWEADHESIAQVGLLGDETGTIKFTSWAKSDLPELEEGQAYRLGNVVTDEYQGNYSVNLNSSTVISRLDEDIEVGDDDQTLSGALVTIQQGSGLIKRCPEQECSRVLNEGRCAEHGDVDGEFDLRIKGVVDDGESPQKVIFDREMTEALTGMTLEEAQQEAMDALDTTVVAQQFRDELVGQYFEIRGPVFGEYLMATAVDQMAPQIDTEQLLITARSIQ